MMIQSVTNGRVLRNLRVHEAKFDRMSCKVQEEEEASRSVTKRQGASTLDTSTTHVEHLILSRNKYAHNLLAINCYRVISHSARLRPLSSLILYLV